MDGGGGSLVIHDKEWQRRLRKKEIGMPRKEKGD
jgi:hypothetical protein